MPAHKGLSTGWVRVHVQPNSVGPQLDAQPNPAELQTGRGSELVRYNDALVSMRVSEDQAVLYSREGKMIQTVIFDLDGVVVFPWRFAQYLEREHGITRSATRDFFGGPFIACLRGEEDVKDVLPPFLKQWKWTDSVDDFVRHWLETENCPDPELMELIQLLRRNGWTCGLGTNQERYRAQFIRKTMSFESLFDHLFISCEMGCMKPELKYFHTAREWLGCPAESILFIDNEQHYIDAAKSAGWNAKLYVSFDDLFDDTDEFFFTRGYRD